MTGSSRFAPLREEFANLRDQVNRVFEETFQAGSTLPLDIYETDESLVIVTGALVGLKLDTLDIAVSDSNQLTLEGETTAPDTIDEAQYLRRERRFGAFSRMVGLPLAVVAEEAKASFKHNVLTITLPKAHANSPKVVKVTPVE